MVGGFPVSAPYQRKLMYQELGAIKIADFGLSKSLTLSKKNPMNSTRKSMDLTTAGVKVDKKAMAAGKDEGMQKETYKLTGETGSYRWAARAWGWARGGREWLAGRVGCDSSSVARGNVTVTGGKGQGSPCDMRRTCCGHIGHLAAACAV
jgi:hypothetical protein